MNEENKFEYVMLMLVSFMFALGSYFLKIKTKETKLTIFNFISEILFSLLAAFLAYKLCLYFSISEHLLWIFTGLASWGGIGFIKRIEEFMNDYLRHKFENDAKKDDNVKKKSEEDNHKEND